MGHYHTQHIGVDNAYLLKILAKILNFNDQ